MIGLVAGPLLVGGLGPGLLTTAPPSSLNPVLVGRLPLPQTASTMCHRLTCENMV